MFKYLVQQQGLHGRSCGLMWKKHTLLLGPESEVASGKISNKFDKQMSLSNKYMLPSGQEARGGRNHLLDLTSFPPMFEKSLYIVSVVLMGCIPCPSLQSSSLIELWSLYIYICKNTKES